MVARFELERPQLVALRGEQARPQPASFGQAWSSYIAGDGARRRLLAIGLGTMAFGMQDVLLEPYGGQVLGMGVGDTTWLTATLAGGGLLGFSLASGILSRGFDPARLALVGAWIGIPAFAAVILASTTLSVPLFVGGALCIGFGAGLFGHGTLTVTMNRAPKEQTGLALGGVLRDIVGALATQGFFGAALARPSTGYAFVYALEIGLLVATIVVMGALVGPGRRLAVAPQVPAGRG